MYKFEDFLKGKFSIYCNNESDKIILLQKLDDLGVRWASNQKASKFGRAMIFDGYGYVIHNGKLKFDCGNSNAVKFKDVDFGGNNMQFTKNNLEVGQFVILRDERRFLVLKTEGGQYYLSNSESCFVGLNGFNNDLTSKTNTDSDVMKVCVPSSPDNLCGILKGFTHGKIIWERENIKEMTLEEVNKILQDTKGFKVKIVE